MILYDDHCFGILLLVKLHGSVLPRSFLFGAISATGTGMLYLTAPAGIMGAWKNPFGYQVFTFIVGFALVFRSSLAYNRFWEARSSIQVVTTRLLAFVVQALSVDLWPNKSFDTQEAKEAAYIYFHKLIHTVSLMYTLMLKHVRHDWDADDMYPHDPTIVPPSPDALAGVGLCNLWRLFFTQCLDVHECLGGGLRVLDHHLPVIGGVLPEEQAMLANPVGQGQLKDRGDDFVGCRVFLVYGLITRLFFDRVSSSPGYKMLPPVLTGLHAGLQEAMMAFGHCHKLASTQFPFPWAQCVMMFLVLLVVTLPFVTVAFITQPAVGIILTFVTVVTYWSLNEVASEMEDPFGLDPNDLPLAHYAFDLNQALIAATYQIRPAWFDELELERMKAGLPPMYGMIPPVSHDTAPDDPPAHMAIPMLPHGGGRVFPHPPSKAV